MQHYAIHSPCMVSPVFPPPRPLGGLLCPSGFKLAFLPPSSGMPAGGLAPLCLPGFPPPPLLSSSRPQRLSRPSLPLPPLPLSSLNLSRSGISLIKVTFQFVQCHKSPNVLKPLKKVFFLPIPFPTSSVIPPEGFNWRRGCLFLPKTSFSTLTKVCIW